MPDVGIQNTDRSGFPAFASEAVLGQVLPRARIADSCATRPTGYRDSVTCCIDSAASGGAVVKIARRWIGQRLPTAAAILGEEDIVGLDVSSETFFEVMTTYRDECRPAISGTLLVAEVRTTGAADWDIAGADISRRNAPEVFWIDASAADQCRPDVSGGFVVYEDDELIGWNGSGAKTSYLLGYRWARQVDDFARLQTLRRP